MPATMTTLMERRLLDAVLGNVALTTGATVYFGLFLTLPDDSGASGQEVPTANNYSRVAIGNSTVQFANATTDTFITTKRNAVAINFPQDNTTDWGQVIGLGIFDAASGGNLLWLADITPYRTIQVGDTASVPASSLAITLD